MIFSQNYRTAWHDTDACRRVRPTQLLVYMQETSNRHLESAGLSLDALRDERGLAFILSKTRVALHAPLYTNEDITVRTWTCESRAFSFSRFYDIWRGEELIAVADTTWALIDLNDKQLCRVDSLDLGIENDAPIDIGIPARFRVPKTEALELLGERKVVYSDLDYNMHMNNTKYADMLCDFLPIEDTGRIRGISMTYLHEAAFGDTVKVYRHTEEGKYGFRTVNQDGTVCLEAEVLLR